MRTQPVNLTQALASFDDGYSPRIVARMNDYDVRIAHTLGEHVWHVHQDTDEFFLVLDGEFHVSLRTVDGTETTVVLRTGDIFVVPRGTEHKPSSPGGSVLMFEPSGTSTTGDRHEVPSPLTSTAPPATSSRNAPMTTRSGGARRTIVFRRGLGRLSAGSGAASVPGAATRQRSPRPPGEEAAAAVPPGP